MQGGWRGKVCYDGIGSDNTGLGTGLSDSACNRSVEGDLLLQRCLLAKK